MGCFSVAPCRHINLPCCDKTREEVVLRGVICTDTYRHQARMSPPPSCSRQLGEGFHQVWGGQNVRFLMLAVPPEHSKQVPVLAKHLALNHEEGHPCQEGERISPCTKGTGQECEICSAPVPSPLPLSLSLCSTLRLFYFRFRCEL